MRKASFRDKYIEVCENTLQNPNGVVVKSALLAHLKLNVLPVVECGKEENGSSTNTTTKTKKKSNSPLQRKRCLRNSDSRTRAEKARGISVYEERIACSKDNEIEQQGTCKNYSIPDDIKKQILIANGLEKECAGYVTTTKPTEHLVDENGNNIGTYFTIAYHNSTPTMSRACTDSNNNYDDDKETQHQYVKIEHFKRTSSVSEGEEEGSESPYSTARDLEEEVNDKTLPRYYVIDDGVCEHGSSFTGCFECNQGYDPIYSEPSSSCGDSDSYKESRYQEQLPPDWLPGQYLKQTIIQQSSNGSGVSMEDSIDGADERFYYSLEEIKDDVEECNSRNGMSKLQNQPKLCNIEEIEESDDDEIFVWEKKIILENI